MGVFYERRWSKLQKELYLIVDPEINFQIHCVPYRMKSNWGGTDLPRYWITLGKEIIFDYPGQFVDMDEELGFWRDGIHWYRSIVNRTRGGFYPYENDASQLSRLIREYIDTPKNDIFDRDFDMDFWGMTDILRAADRRIGARRLEALRGRSEAADRIIDARLCKKVKNSIKNTAAG